MVQAVERMSCDFCHLTRVGRSVDPRTRAVRLLLLSNLFYDRTYSCASQPTSKAASSTLMQLSNAYPVRKQRQTAPRLPTQSEQPHQLTAGSSSLQMRAQVHLP